MEAAIDTRRNLPLKKGFSKILNSEIANGNASDDTVKTYTQQFKLFVAWCDRVGLRLETATEEDILDYRRYLVNKKLSHATISLKLTVIRRIYAIALKRGFVATNPARDVQPPPKRRDPVAWENNYLEKAEAQELIDVLPVEKTVVALRDRLLVSLMVIQGCRQIGLYRLNVGDIIRRRGQIALRLDTKGSQRVIPLTSDVAAVLEQYLKARKAEGEKLLKSSPMFVSKARNSDGNRLTRRSMQNIVNSYLEKAELKHNETRTVTTHGLRHTVGYLLTALGRPLREVQEALGHSDPRTTAIYAHIVSLWENNPWSRLGLAV